MIGFGDVCFGSDVDMRRVKDDKPYHIRAISACPYHNEKTPSCVVDMWSHDEEPQISDGKWRCLGCGCHGVVVVRNLHDAVGELGIIYPAVVTLV